MKLRSKKGQCHPHIYLRGEKWVGTKLEHWWDGVKFEEIFARLGRVLKSSKEFKGYQKGCSQATRERQSKRENLIQTKSFKKWTSISNKSDDYWNKLSSDVGVGYTGLRGSESMACSETQCRDFNVGEAWEQCNGYLQPNRRGSTEKPLLDSQY